MNIFLRSDVMDMAEEIPSSGLHWEGAPAGQLTFMRGVYDRHVAQAGRQRRFVADVPDAELGVVEGRYKLHTPAAASCRALLEEARAELARQRALGISQAQQVRYVRVNSAYRSASEQFRIWQNAFPRHFRATQEARQALPGGDLGDQAVNYLARYIGQRIAAPGYSLHNNGLAVDFGTHEGGLTLGASSQGIAHWRRSWFYHWLTENAARFGFYENRAIDEPWHWEYRQPAQPRTEGIYEHSRPSLPPYDSPSRDRLAQYAEDVVARRSRDYIIWLQTSLNQLIAAGLEVDGAIGRQTQEAIRAFQARRGLTVDGVVGPRTEAALIAAGAPPPPRPALPQAAAGPPDIVTVRGILIARRIAPQVEALLAAAETDGIRLSGGGWRSRETQIELRRRHCGPSYYDIYEKPSSQCTPPTARPGHSMHEQGLAIDFRHNGQLIRSREQAAFLWLSQHAARFGFYNLPSEPWHWSVNGR